MTRNNPRLHELILVAMEDIGKLDDAQVRELARGLEAEYADDPGKQIAAKLFRAGIKAERGI